MQGERVAQLELILRSHPEGLRKSEIARKLGVHRSTVGRYVEDLKQFNDVFEENNLVKISPKEQEDGLNLSVYEILALNLGADMLRSKAAVPNPHLASGLRKIAMSMESYAPKISENIRNVAEEIENDVIAEKNSSTCTMILESLIDAWVSGRMVRIFHSENNKSSETELAPYFIGYIDTETGRMPITVTGRLRHTTEVVTIDIARISEVTVLDETYTIPDNLKAFNRKETPEQVSGVYDTVKLELLVKQLSALNSFRILAHGKISVVKTSKGNYRCSFEAENSIELILRIIQCMDEVEILGPKPFRDRFVSILRTILHVYEERKLQNSLH